MKKRVVVLVSGGVDSVTALYQAAREHEVIAGLSFNYGSKHNHRELPCAAWHCQSLSLTHHLIGLDFMGTHFASALLQTGGAIPEGHYEEANMKQTVVPFRNGIMLSIAAGFAESIGASGLVIASHSGDHAIYPDCREEFMEAMSWAIRLGTYAQLEVMRPFIRSAKSDIIRVGAELAVDFTRTWSCYKGDKVQCGVCGTCVERREAFQLAGIPDPTEYDQQPPLPPKPAPHLPA